MVIESLDKQSQGNLADLLTRIRAKECCAFIGAGLSRPAGYPLWADLLGKLKSEAETAGGGILNDENSDYYDRAEDYRRILGTENYRTIINSEFNPDNNKQPWLPVHLELVEMPFVSLITTNYDCMLENAYQRKERQPIYSYYPTLPISHLRDHQIYHIHGVIDHANLSNTQDSIILTRSDFNQAYASGSNLLNLITCIYTELTIFFVGFNVRDQLMMRILKSSLSEFERTKNIAFERGVGPLKNIKHYALLPFPKSKKVDEFGRTINTNDIDQLSTKIEDQELQSLGVYTIRYMSDEYNHTQLINIIGEMNSTVNGKDTRHLSQDLTFREHN